MELGAGSLSYFSFAQQPENEKTRLNRKSLIGFRNSFGKMFLNGGDRNPVHRAGIRRLQVDLGSNGSSSNQGKEIYVAREDTGWSRANERDQGRTRGSIAERLGNAAGAQASTVCRSMRPCHGE